MPVESMVASLKNAVGVRGSIVITTSPLIQFREISTDSIQDVCSIRCEIARGSTLANFSPGVTFAISRIVRFVSRVGAPSTATEETENIDDHAKR